MKKKQHSRRSSNSSAHESDIEASDASDNEKVQKKFKLDAADHAIVTMKCHYKSRHGKLRLTVEHLCFLASIQLGGSKKKLIALKDILDIECSDDKGVTLTLRNGKSPTFLFKENREAFNYIENQWINTGNGRGNSATLLNNSIENMIDGAQSSNNNSQRNRGDSINSNGSNGGVANYRYSGNFESQLNQSLTLENKISDSYGNDIEKATASMKRHFDVPHSETLVREYQCAHKGSLMQHHGKLYVTERFLFFYSGLASRHQKFTIKLLDVVDICLPEKSKKSILISTKDEAYLFTAFKYKRSVVFKQLNDFWFDSKQHGEVPELKVSVGGFTNTPIQMLISDTEAGMNNQSPKSRHRTGSISDRLEKIENLSTPIVLPEDKKPEEDTTESTTATTTTADGNDTSVSSNITDSNINNNSNSGVGESNNKSESTDKLDGSSGGSKSSKSSIWKPSKNRLQLKFSRDKSTPTEQQQQQQQQQKDQPSKLSNSSDKNSSTTYQNSNSKTSNISLTSTTSTPLPKSNTVSSYSSVSSIIASKPNVKMDSMDVAPPTSSTPLFKHDPRLTTKVKKRCCCF
ncbi:hypothetical protein PPL_09242 [Heterostelium album PN500]|uniref:GRAM domain-containing protein n=1 Tax=Heterostelium pallidum (strain ATCC 26659 / Pp 5 / PN500) TaxID=670386 RepID=D3BL10_HETP5|nr:hypothetical protein PPL_09242 [Heterostelium album PN500]EFA78590.1 hypothetical protein PPL_09242 [Heterostelium album PN500]|eukprot:XP_020430714.1 hypothetical protein PPL_09242 [Heterostelium album PN500]